MRLKITGTRTVEERKEVVIDVEDAAAAELLAGQAEQFRQVWAEQQLQFTAGEWRRVQRVHTPVAVKIERA